MADYRRIEFSGSFEEMPPFLEWFPVPVSRAFAKSVLKVKSPKTDKHYGDDEYRIDRGNVFYSHREAYDLPWAEAVRMIDFALQVESAETGNAESPMIVAVYRQDSDARQLARERAIETTQRRLVDFLWSGKLSEL